MSHQSACQFGNEFAVAHDLDITAAGRGQEEGRIQGEKIGSIHTMERLLNRPQTPVDQLIPLALEDLSRLADELQAQVMKQR